MASRVSQGPVCASAKYGVEWLISWEATIYEDRHDIDNDILRLRPCRQPLCQQATGQQQTWRAGGG